MILLFNSKASKSSTTNKNSNVKNHPVENSGILAMSLSDAKSTLTMGEYDSYISSNPVAINYAAYSNSADYSSDSDYSGFMGSFSSAIATLGDSGMAAASFGGASFSGASSFSCSSSSSFSSVG